MGLNPKKIISSVTIDGEETHLVDGGIPDGYIKPSGEVTITEQGSFDVSQYKTAIVTAPFDSKFAQLINGTITEVTQEDLQGNTKVNAYAFYNQNRLKKVNLPNTIASIGASAFSGCTYLQSINLGENITSVGDTAFQNCQSLRQPIFLSPNTSVGRNVFSNSGITKFKGYGYKTTSNDNSFIFSNCLNIKEAEFNEGFLRLSQMNGGASIKAIKKFILPSTCIFISLNELYQSVVIIKAETPPTLSNYHANIALNNTIYVPYESIDQYKVKTNYTSFVVRPLVKTYEDLSTIDTTLYTKACVEGNEKGIEDENNYKIYNYTDGEWVAV